MACPRPRIATTFSSIALGSPGTSCLGSPVWPSSAIGHIPSGIFTSSGGPERLLYVAVVLDVRVHRGIESLGDLAAVLKQHFDAVLPPVTEVVERAAQTVMAIKVCGTDDIVDLARLHVVHRLGNR